MSGYITCEDMAKNNIDSLKEALQIALEALDFYADKENYKKHIHNLFHIPFSWHLLQDPCPSPKHCLTIFESNIYLSFLSLKLS